MIGIAWVVYMITVCAISSARDKLRNVLSAKRTGPEKISWVRELSRQRVALGRVGVCDKRLRPHPNYQMLVLLNTAKKRRVEIEKMIDAHSMIKDQNTLPSTLTGFSNTSTKT